MSAVVSVSPKGRSAGGSPSKLRQSAAAAAAAEPHFDQINRSRRVAAKTASAVSDEPLDDYEDENYEGEESFRLVDPLEDLDYSTGSGVKYRGTYGSNSSPPSKSFLSDTYTTSSYGSGSKYGRSASGGDYDSPTYKYEEKESVKSGTSSVPIWLKLLLLVALTVFIFFIIQRVIENSPPAITNEDEQI
uniref:Uncharacterized protein n=1 Tax=Plectus sambesii TaxID=2011161 RepID=A0A914VNF7_9BILA